MAEHRWHPAYTPVRIQNVVDWALAVDARTPQISSNMPPWRCARLAFRLGGEDWMVCVRSVASERAQAELGVAGDAFGAQAVSVVARLDVLVNSASGWLCLGTEFCGWLADGRAAVGPDGKPGFCRTVDTLDAARTRVGRAFALLAFQFCHCKNVTVVADPVPPQRVLRKREAKGKPWVRWHTIRIDALAARKSPSRSEQDEAKIERALHICRGHFATYTEEAPLFGKYAGRFWVPQHTRGDGKRGVVLKDYEVRT